MSKSLKKLLKKLVVPEAQEELLVSDAKLGNLIKVGVKKNFSSNVTIKLELHLHLMC